MSYLLPRENDEFLGHDEAEQIFITAGKEGSLAGSWLICGSKGIGKATLAYRLARFLFAKPSFEQTSSLYVEKSNPVFSKVAAQSHLDLRVLERSLTVEENKKIKKILDSGKLPDPEEAKTLARKTVITVDDVREIENFLSLTSDGGWRVVIVDAADEMNEASTNAILKILEEPPKKTVMILIAHNAGRLLPTIISRCKKVFLRPLSIDNTVNLLQKFIPEIDEKEALAAAKFAEGSVGRALEIVETNGVDICKNFISLFLSLPNYDALKIYDFAVSVGGDEKKYVISQELIVEMFSRIAKALVTGSNDFAIDGEGDVTQFFLTKGLTAEDVAIFREKICDIFSRTNGLNLDRKVAIMNIFFKAAEIFN